MSTTIDRRTFLTTAPRQFLSGVKALMHDVAAFAWSVADGQERAVRQRVALLDVSRCLAWSGTDCQICYLRCPKRDEAMRYEEGRPAIVTSVCDGCGICIDVCRAVNDLEAIQLVDVTTSRVTT